MSTDSLLRGQMENIRSRNPQTILIRWSTAGTGALLVYWPKVVGIGGIAEIQGACLGDPISEALSGKHVFSISSNTYSCSSGPDTVKHIRP